MGVLSTVNQLKTVFTIVMIVKEILADGVLVDSLRLIVNKLEEAAEATPTELDDQLIAKLKALLGEEE